MRYSAWTAAALVAALGAALPAAAQSTVYKWVDSQGNVHFSDTPPNEPAKSVTQRRLGGGLSEDSSALPYATQVAMKKNPVTLYGAPQCGDPCSQGRALLSSRGIPYTERDAQNNPADAEAVRKLIGALQVPVLLIGENSLRGYDATAWHAALDGAGYPRTKLPGTIAPKPRVVEPPKPEPPKQEPVPENAEQPAESAQPDK
jgi:glutaredoxin